MQKMPKCRESARTVMGDSGQSSRWSTERRNRRMLENNAWHVCVALCSQDDVQQRLYVRIRQRANVLSLLALGGLVCRVYTVYTGALYRQKKMENCCLKKAGYWAARSGHIMVTRHDIPCHRGWLPLLYFTGIQDVKTFFCFLEQHRGHGFTASMSKETCELLVLNDCC